MSARAGGTTAAVVAEAATVAAVAAVGEAKGVVAVTAATPVTCRIRRRLGYDEDNTASWRKETQSPVVPHRLVMLPMR